MTEGFFEKWNTILSDSGNGLVQLLLSESLQVVKKLDKELDSELRKYILMPSEKNEFNSKINTRTIRKN